MIPANWTFREKTALMVVVVFAALLVLFQFGITPLLKERLFLNRKLDGLRSSVQKMHALQREYFQQGRAEHMVSDRLPPSADFSLYAYLDAIAGAAGIKERVAAIRPTEQPGGEGGHRTVGVAMTLSGIDLPQLTDFLYRIEYGKEPIWTRTVTIARTAGEPALIDAVFQVETAMPASP